jgi:hypothetical protein
VCIYYSFTPSWLGICQNTAENKQADKQNCGTYLIAITVHIDNIQEIGAFFHEHIKKAIPTIITRMSK